MDIEHVVRHPVAGRKNKRPLLLLHGAWHGAWCWERWIDYFLSLGYEVHAISLPGHGASPLKRKSLNAYTLGDYVDVLAEAISGISPSPVVIGHSLGGAILQKYIACSDLPGSVLLASVPSAGAFKMVLRLLKRRPVSTLKGLLSCNSFHWVATSDLAKDLFFGSDLVIDIDGFQGKLVKESLLASLRIMLPLVKSGRVKTPVLVLSGGEDAVFTVSEGRETAEAYGAEFVVFDGQAHNLMIEPAWKKVADKIDHWIKTCLG